MIANPQAPYTRLTTPTQAPRKDQKLVQEAYREDLRIRLMAVERLMQSDGWKLLEAALLQSEQSAYTKMETDSSLETARHFGAHNALKMIREWPDKSVKYLRSQIETINQQLAPK